MHTSPIPNPTSQIDSYSAELAAARLAALRALADIVTTTEDPAEKRRAAAAILRLPDPPNPKEPLASARGAALPINTAPFQSSHTHPPNPHTLVHPTTGMTLKETLAYAEKFLAEYEASHPTPNPAPIPDPLQEPAANSPAARLAASAGHIPSG